MESKTILANSILSVMFNRIGVLGIPDTSGLPGAYGMRPYARLPLSNHRAHMECAPTRTGDSLEYNLPNRKSTRLKGYDYSQAGFYFVTICTENRMNILGIIGGEESMLEAPQITLNHAGQMIEKILLGLQNEFDNVLIDRYVIMPNHLHCIVSIKEDARAHMECAPTALGNIVQSFKRHTTIEYIKGVKSGTYPPFEKRVWQRNYYEHIIRNDEDYLRICQYIDENPIKWTQDEYYVT